MTTNVVRYYVDSRYAWFLHINDAVFTDQLRLAPFIQPQRHSRKLCACRAVKEIGLGGNSTIEEPLHNNNIHGSIVKKLS